MEELSTYWYNLMSGFGADGWIGPLHQHEMLPRDGAGNDYMSIEWKTLLGDSASPHSLSLAKSESEFLARLPPNGLQITRRYDVDSIIARPLSMKRCNLAFSYAGYAKRVD